MSTPAPAGTAPRPDLQPLPWDEDTLVLPALAEQDPVTLRFSLGAIRAYETLHGNIFGLGSTALSQQLDFLRCFAVGDDGERLCPDDEAAFRVYRSVGVLTLRKAQEAVVSRMLEAGGFTPAEPTDASPPD